MVRRVEKNMLRAGLALYLMLATTAGPWFCCCSVKRLVSLLTPAPVQQAKAEHTDPPPSCCCCHHEKAEQPPPSDESPRNGPLPCPCREGRCAPVVAIAAEPPPSAKADWKTSAWDCLVFLPVDLASHDVIRHSPAAAENTVFPFLHCRDILAVLHILRC